MTPTGGKPSGSDPIIDVTGYDPRLNDSYADETGRSNIIAFLMGGVVIAGGLLAFLFYDNGQEAAFTRDPATTGSITRADPNAGAVPNITVPSRRAQPAPSGPAPVTPQ